MAEALTDYERAADLYVGDAQVQWTIQSRIAVVPAPTWLAPTTTPPPQQGQASSASTDAISFRIYAN